jgi:hypothetical protein
VIDRLLCTTTVMRCIMRGFLSHLSPAEPDFCIIYGLCSPHNLLNLLFTTYYPSHCYNSSRHDNSTMTSALRNSVSQMPYELWNRRPRFPLGAVPDTDYQATFQCCFSRVFGLLAWMMSIHLLIHRILHVLHIFILCIYLIDS